MGADRTEYVYLIASEGSSLVKIGRTMNVTKRLAQIQCKSPVRLSVLWQIEGDAEMEFGLHRLFKPYRSHGEWFDFADHDPVAMVKEAVLLGLHERGAGLDELETRTPLPEQPPLAHGAVVRILTDWPGPRYGVIRSVTLNPLSKEVTGYGLGGSGVSGRTFHFRCSEVEAATSRISRSYAEGLWENSPDPADLLSSRTRPCNDGESGEAA